MSATPRGPSSGHAASRRRWWAAAAAPALAVLATAALLTLPLAREATPSGTRAVTLAAQQGLPAAAVLLLPVALTIAPLALPRHRRAALAVASALLWGFALAGAASVGLWYLPAAAAQTAAAVRSPRSG